tara:strand:- start:136585 stop:136845 length:261 start_codon:yes stop_codon:yes gene_type:complete
LTFKSEAVLSWHFSNVAVADSFLADDTDTPIIDFQQRRRERLHLVHDARLEEVRSAFEKAFPIPGKPLARDGKPAKKKKKKNPRKS